MVFEVGGIIGLIVLIADVWAVVNVFQSAASIGVKVFWIVFIIILPLSGLIVCLCAGPMAVSRYTAVFLPASSQLAVTSLPREHLFGRVVLGGCPAIDLDHVLGGLAPEEIKPVIYREYSSM